MGHRSFSPREDRLCQDRNQRVSHVQDVMTRNWTRRILCRLVVRETAGFEGRGRMNARRKLVGKLVQCFFCVFVHLVLLLHG